MAVNLLELLELGSVLVYEELNDHGTCPISLSQAGACERATSLKAGTKERRRIDGTGARIFRSGTDRGIRLARALELACKGRENIEVISTEQEHWLTVGPPNSLKGSWPIASAAAIVTALEGTHGAKLPVRMTTIAAGGGAFIQVRGHSDVVVRIGKKLHVLDFKTANEWALKKVNVNDHTSSNTSYLVQLACYSSALLEEQDNVGAAALIYENSNNKELVGPVWLPHECIEQYAELGRANLASVLNSVLTGAPPDRPFGPDDRGKLPWQCNYCDVAKQCWGDAITDTTGGDRIPKWAVL